MGHTMGSVHRLVVIASACQYIFISMAATWRTIQVLFATKTPTEPFEVYTASLIPAYMGNELVYDSPLVQEVLGGDTSPRDYALFLESEIKTSTEGCSEVPLLNPDIYNYAFLSQSYEKIVTDSTYNSAILSELELVTIVVDCSFTQLKLGDKSAVRVFNLLRSKKDHDVMYVATVSLSIQDYKIRAHRKSGPALVGMVTIVDDMRAEAVEQFYIVVLTYPFQRALEFQVYDFVGITNQSFIELRSIPEDPLTQAANNLIIAREHGFYDGHEQFNIRYTYSLLESMRPVQ